MSRATPEEAFAEAQAAMARGDWEGFFACLDADTLVRIAENGVNRFLGGGETSASALAALCAEHAVPGERLVELRALQRRMVESAAAQMSPADSADPGAMRQRSLRHKAIVDEHRTLLKGTLKAVPDLPRFTAALERTMRTVMGGGSVSPRLFVDEALEDVSIDGAKARATRRASEGHVDDVGFVKRKGGWSIRVFAKRPGRG